MANDKNYVEIFHDGLLLKESITSEMNVILCKPQMDRTGKQRTDGKGRAIFLLTIEVEGKSNITGKETLKEVNIKSISTLTSGLHTVLIERTQMANDSGYIQQFYKVIKSISKTTAQKAK